jgi:flagellar biosynthesis protein
MADRQLEPKYVGGREGGMNMRKQAVALRYEKTQEHAPRVVAKGSGEIADRIIELARDARVALHEDVQLTDMLMSLDVDSVIPQELYEVVAEVLAFVHRAGTHGD